MQLGAWPCPLLVQADLKKTGRTRATELWQVSMVWNVTGRSSRGPDKASTVLEGTRHLVVRAARGSPPPIHSKESGTFIVHA